MNAIYFSLYLSKYRGKNNPIVNCLIYALDTLQPHKTGNFDTVVFICDEIGGIKEYLSNRYDWVTLYLSMLRAKDQTLIRTLSFSASVP